MPSPLAHSAVAFAAYRLHTNLSEGSLSGRHRLLGLPTMLIIFVAVSLMPDADALIGIALGDMIGFHNQWTHSLLSGIVVTLVVAAATYGTQRQRFLWWWIWLNACYTLHIAMDYVSRGRGVMALWPLSERRFGSPVALFTGLHWSEGLLSPWHLVTVANELGFVLLLGAAFRIVPYLARRARTRAS